MKSTCLQKVPPLFGLALNARSQSGGEYSQTQRGFVSLLSNELRMADFTTQVAAKPLLSEHNNTRLNLNLLVRVL